MKEKVQVFLFAGVLATALLAGTACKQPNGGNEYHYQEPTQPTNPDTTKPDETEQFPAYYRNEELAGQAFVENNVDWFGYDQNRKNEAFAERFQNAEKFIDAKVADLQQTIQGQTNVPLYKDIDTALKKINNNGDVTDIYANYCALAPVFATFQSHDIFTDSIDFNQYKVSYYRLAQNAYNNSLGSYGQHESPDFNTNKEMNPDGFFFTSELADAKLTYPELTQNAKQIMLNSLSKIADATNTNAAVLQKVIELALYNESLYGLNDFAVRCEVDNGFSRETQRCLNGFDSLIYEAIQNTNTQTVDDRTM